MLIIHGVWMRHTHVHPIEGGGNNPPTLDHLTSITDAANPSFSPFSALMEKQTMPALLYVPSEQTKESGCAYAYVYMDATYFHGRLGKALQVC